MMKFVCIIVLIWIEIIATEYPHILNNDLIVPRTYVQRRFRRYYYNPRRKSIKHTMEEQFARFLTENRLATECDVCEDYGTLRRDIVKLVRMMVNMITLLQRDRIKLNAVNRYISGMHQTSVEHWTIVRRLFNIRVAGAPGDPGARGPPGDMGDLGCLSGDTKPLPTNPKLNSFEERRRALNLLLDTLAASSHSEFLRRRSRT